VNVDGDRMSFRSENERHKVEAFLHLGIQGRLTDFAQHAAPNFTRTAVPLHAD